MPNLSDHIDIITARPEGMNFDAYRIRRRISNQQLKDRHRYGEFIFISCEPVMFWNEAKKEHEWNGNYTHGNTFRGSVKRDLIKKSSI